MHVDSLPVKALNYMELKMMFQHYKEYSHK